MGLFGTSEAELKKQLQSALKELKFLDTDQPFLNIAQVQKVKLKRRCLILTLELTIPCVHRQVEITQQLSTHLANTVKFDTIDLTLSVSIKSLNRSDKITNIKQLVLVASGKGGVGKSTTAVNLALALRHGGAKVGMLDADIYGPSLPTLLGAEDQRPNTTDDKLMSPLMLHGLTTMSIGYLVDKNDATVWRGPMAAKALSQLLFETNWGELDYLIVDMPPGTGDIQLTMSGQVPVSGAIVVTTPQNLALHDAQKGISMFNKVKVPVLGVIENMSYHQCSVCGNEDHIFGKQGGEQLAKDNKVSVLGHLPLDPTIGLAADNGLPTVVSDPTSSITHHYLTIAQAAAIKLNQTDLTIPSIVIEE
ncbi:iron-sulfur cluster carrier protein ApbC [Psychrobium sp. 1_MG-2023]|uniref:iron-sulfur cluster carrier protein ApbC n=1 Tax=Psychrobium sp. 1_MG-2023 TaxID=3062624 RepID=UPI000C34FA89|nr:iron-sulfur cluster carrier protein ApbC [Psychrobium sp. 1_MG-2023]MDP2561679.1 iron-sulfur cluster carrier protein ApbC [Psychrobium sp. 1_MG-2023]PKF57083.1 iron-sulfur cluster carrier protein ApbC [Alteromonadales bacterium alter-6D02]